MTGFLICPGGRGRTALLRAGGNRLHHREIRRYLFAIFVVAASLVATPAIAQVCAGLPADAGSFLTLNLGGRHDKPPLTSPQYLATKYTKSLGSSFTLRGSARVPIGHADHLFERGMVELTAAFPRSVGPGCPVLTAGYSVQNGVHEASPHAFFGYGAGWRWDRKTDARLLGLYAIPGVLLDRKQDYQDGSLSNRARLAADVGFLISSHRNLFFGGALRRAFADGGGTAMEVEVGWRF